MLFAYQYTHYETKLAEIDYSKKKKTILSKDTYFEGPTLLLQRHQV